VVSRVSKKLSIVGVFAAAVLAAAPAQAGTVETHLKELGQSVRTGVTSVTHDVVSFFGFGPDQAHNPTDPQPLVLPAAPELKARAIEPLAVVANAALPAVPAVAEDYPTWDEVQAAKADVTSREAEASRITAFVDELEAEAGRLGDAAVEAAAASAAAEAARAAAETRATTLRAEADAATAEAEASAARLGRVGAVLARSGGADVGLRLFFDDGSASDLLMGLSRAAQLAGGSTWECPFPLEADDAGVDHAVVSLRIEVAADGHVLSANATRDPGHGFVREARRCALSKRWSAGLDRAGQPVNSTTVVNVRFER